jgi:hypothetical protein
VRAHDRRSLGHRNRRRGDAGSQPIPDLATGELSEHALARKTDQQRIAQRCQGLQTREQAQVVCERLAETEAGIDQNPVAGDAGRLADASTLDQKAATSRTTSR